MSRRVFLPTLRAGCLLGAVLALAVTVRGQAEPDTVVFEPVGDRPLDARGLDFGPDGTLWAVFIGISKLAPGSDSWEMVTEQSGDNILVLSSDTLVVTFATNVYRSTDAGSTWETVFVEGDALFEAPSWSAHPGLLLTSTKTEGHGVAYSLDRGETWTEAPVSPSSSWTPEALDFAEIPAGPNRGRLVAGSMNGVYLSDDGGQSWNASALFQDGRYRVESVAVAGDGRLYAALSDATVPGGQVYVSADDGDTWNHAFTARYPALLVAVPSPPEGDGAIYALQQAVSTSGGGVDLYRSYDGAEWALVGALPNEPAIRFVRDFKIGPDGRLYVGLIKPGDPDWVYRSADPVVVANEPLEAPPSPDGTLRVWPNPSGAVLHVEIPDTARPSGAEVIMTDVRGRVVRRTRTVGGKAAADVSGLAPGVYSVRVGGQTEVVTVRR